MRVVTKSAAALMFTALVLSGCADPARERSSRAIGSLDNTRGVLVDGRRQVDAAVVDLDKLAAKPADLSKPFKDFQNAIVAIERQAVTCGARVQDMRLRAAEYRTAWDEDAARNISDPALRAASAERAERVKARYDRIDQQAQDVRTAYDPFITELRDLDTFLSNDLTYAGVDTARPMIDSARRSAMNLNEKIDTVLASLDEATARLSPTTAPLP